MAAAVSVLAIALIAGLQHFVGYIPMLFLPAILLVEVEWGIGPAVLATVLCTMGSVLLTSQTAHVDAKLYTWANLLLLPGIAASLIYLMEMRRRHQRIEHERGVELS